MANAVKTAMIDERGQRHFTARAHAPEGAAGIEPAEHEEDGTEREDAGDDDEVAVRERPVESDEGQAGGDERRAREHDVRRETEHPRSRRRDDHLLLQERGIGGVLQQRRRAVPALQARLAPADEPGGERREREDDGRLDDGKEERRHTAMISVAASAIRMNRR